MVGGRRETASFREMSEPVKPASRLPCSFKLREVAAREPSPYHTQLLRGSTTATFPKLPKNAGVKIAFLTSETKAAEKRKMLAGIESGEISLIVGTHSIFAEPVQYHNLGLVVIDEEHKFGVVHRGNFMEKGVPGCHKITMSATPIPKSLADTVSRRIPASSLLPINRRTASGENRNYTG